MQTRSSSYSPPRPTEIGLKLVNALRAYYMTVAIRKFEISSKLHAPELYPFFYLYFVRIIEVQVTNLILSPLSTEDNYGEKIRMLCFIIFRLKFFVPKRSDHGTKHLHPSSVGKN